MPNHIHGILVITETVGANNYSPLQPGQRPHGTSKTIGSVIRGFKIGERKWMHAHTNVHDVRQRNYYEHIIRNKDQPDHVDVCSNLSASQILMIDCRGTPSRLASLSRERIIQSGKSTLTLFCSFAGRPAFERSRCLVRSFPSSNALSKSLAFIYFNLLMSCSAHRDNSYVLTTICDNSRPVVYCYLSNN